MLPALQRLLSRAGLPAPKRGEPATRVLGRRGERLAASHLRRQGYRVLARNLRTPIGEADIVCLAPDRRTVVIIEVKSRLRRPQPIDARDISARRASAPAAEYSITARKRRKLLHLAQDIARRRRWTDRPLRIDVVAVEWSDPRARPEIRHHPCAVTLND